MMACESDVSSHTQATYVPGKTKSVRLLLTGLYAAMFRVEPGRDVRIWDVGVPEAGRAP